MLFGSGASLAVSGKLGAIQHFDALVGRAVHYSRLEHGCTRRAIRVRSDIDHDAAGLMDTKRRAAKGDVHRHELWGPTQPVWREHRSV